MKRQKGFAEAYIYLGLAVVALAAFTGTYFYGRSTGKEIVQTAWDKDRAAKIIASEIKRTSDIAYAVKVQIEKIEAEEVIAALTSQIKAKEYQNETQKYCTAAPNGSVLLTASRLRDFTRIYNAGLRKNNPGK